MGNYGTESNLNGLKTGLNYSIKHNKLKLLRDYGAFRKKFCGGEGLEKCPMILILKIVLLV